MDKWPPMVSKVHASGQIGTIILQGPPTFPWDFARPSMQGHSLLAWASLSKVILHKSCCELFLLVEYTTDTFKSWLQVEIVHKTKCLQHILPILWT